jgi:peptide-methionine (R)-S-oxide reductase
MNRRRMLAGGLASLFLAACRGVGIERLGVVAQAGREADPGEEPELLAGGSCALGLDPGGRVDWAGHFEPGEYQCAVCGQALFTSEAKFDPGTPWPSFYAPIEGAVVPVRDRQDGRISESAVECSQCGAPLGDIYRDGPPPTGIRYCIVSAALVFAPAP